MKDYTQGLTKQQTDAKAAEMLDTLYGVLWYNLEYDHKDKSRFYYRYNLQGYSDKQIFKNKQFRFLTLIQSII